MIISEQQQHKKVAHTKKNISIFINATTTNFICIHKLQDLEKKTK